MCIDRQHLYSLVTLDSNSIDIKFVAAAIATQYVIRTHTHTIEMAFGNCAHVSARECVYGAANQWGHTK